MARQNEIWKDIPGYEGLYAVSDLGRIKSYDRTVHQVMNGGGLHQRVIKGRLMKQYLNDSGYYFIRLSENGNQASFYTHILLAKTFMPNCDQTLVVNHKDGDKLNNNIINLEWVTRSENQLHAYANGLQKVVNGDTHHLTKLKQEDINEIKEWVKKGVQQKTLAERYNVSRALINIIIKGKHRKYA